MKDVLLIGLGGFVGSVLRYLISLALASTAVLWPWHTFVVNVVGSLLIGALWVFVQPSPSHGFLVVGICGGFTTFSSFSLELMKLYRGGHFWHAFSYASLSVVLSLLAVALGAYLATKYNS